MPVGGGVKLTRLPLEGLGAANGHSSPKSMRLGSTFQSNFHLSDGKQIRRGGSAYKHDGVFVPGSSHKPTYGNRSSSNDRIESRSSRHFHQTTEQAALAILSHRFGLRDFSRGRMAGSNILYRASYKPKRYPL
eukprot:CAMPEP_0185594326 /NCGR_PEP_ID=MMETSP0434-20130131/74461_1 /TAXON_ID=626734 ORGANISM="Favella taraikaensis, Strain Fe Narragansett Bay" /NCGR_SAMPLE_ID=MMETSP0434 /ASSEMBLY_ACC=CAM_ASM_000379 /LENGTH=132 /DNA_ID=CAMNT_0028221571 /DNA_START=2077 /DNA_END=2475 /DNA_ORIENTATION=-